MKTNNKNIPALRFPEFTNDWNNYALEGLLIDYKLGGNYSNTEIQSDYPLIKMGNLGRGNIILNKIEYIENGEIINDADKVCFGDLFFNTRNTLDLVGKVAIWRAEMPVAYYNSNLMRLRFENNFFMNYRLNSYDGIKALRRLAIGTTSVAAIYTRDLLKLRLNIPCNSEQQKIADFLTAVDERIQQLTKKKELLERYKKGVMQKLFSQEIRFKDEHGNDYPDWEEKRLGEVTYKVDKKNKEGKKFPIYSINNVKGFVPQSEQFDGLDSNERGFDIGLYKIVDNRTFAYNPARINVGSLGYNRSYGTVIISSLYVCFKTTAIIYDEFLNYFFKTDYFNQSVATHGEGGVRIYLFFENFSRIKINLPSIDEQKRIADFIEGIDKKIQKIQAQIDKTKEFKKGLLQQMFV